MQASAQWKVVQQSLWILKEFVLKSNYNFI